MYSYTEKRAIEWSLFTLVLVALFFGFRTTWTWAHTERSLFYFAISINMFIVAVLIFNKMTKLITYRMELSSSSEYFLVSVGSIIMALTLLSQFMNRQEALSFGSAIIDVLYAVGTIASYQAVALALVSWELLMP